MKFTKVSGFVFLLHAILVTLLIFQSGCQNMEYTPEPNVCPYVESAPVAPMAVRSCPTCPIKPAPIVKDNFMEATCTVVNEPVSTARFKPMRPTYDFSNDGLLTSLDDLEPMKPIKPIASVPVESAISHHETYTVKSGDSLWIIAKRYNVGTNEIANANGMNRDATLKVGQKLVIPVKANNNISASNPTVEGGFYTIAKGDTLSEIAMRFKVPVDALKRANNLQGNNIIAGKKIIIPGVNSEQIAQKSSVVRSTPMFSSSSKEGGYHVQNGDSLSVIANRFGVSVADLMTWNNMSDAKKLRAGQTLIVKDPNQMVAHTAPSSNFDSSVMKIDTINVENEVPAPVNEEEAVTFDFFADDDLFGTEDEIPVVTFDEE